MRRLSIGVQPNVQLSENCLQFGHLLALLASPIEPEPGTAIPGREACLRRDAYELVRLSSYSEAAELSALAFLHGVAASPRQSSESPLNLLT